MSVTNSDLKNIVDEWVNTNSDDIVKGLEIKSPKELLDYERKLLSILMQLGALIITWILNIRLQDKSFQKYAKQKIIPRKSKLYKHQTDLNTPIRTLFGNIIKPKLRYYVPKGRRGRKCKLGNRGKNGSGIYPALEVLGIQFGSTPALAGEVARSVADGPSMKAAKVNLHRWGISLDIKTIRRISEAFADTGLAIRDAWLEEDDPHNTPLITETESFRGKRILISTDGGRIRIRKNKRGRISNGNKRHGYNTNWREPKLITIRTIDKNGKVIRGDDPIIDGTIGTPDDIFELLRVHLVARDVQQASEIVCVGDGALWIWNRMEKLVDALEIDASKVDFVLDFYHAVEHLSAVADGKRGWNKRKRKKWLEEMRKRLKQGDVDEILDELKELARGRNAKTVKREMNYFKENKERMKYDVIMNKKLPIGSGAMESGIRQVVNMRLKSAGMFWNKENAEGFLHLRCYLKSRRWDIIEQAVINYCPKIGRV
jgi:hypothetical protein